MKKIKNIALFAGVAIAAMVAVSMASSRTAATAPTDQAAFINAAESTVNGVVSVKSYATPRMQQGYGGGMDFFDPFEFFFGSPFGGNGGGNGRQRQQQPEPKEQQLGLGSGVIISEDGYIVTNNHVIADAERLEVTLNDNRNYDAIVIGADPTTDIALIKIEADNLHVIPMGDSENLHIGEWVLAVGNPLGLSSTVTSGIVSAKGRNISNMSRSGNRQAGIESYIQTDAALNAGNSGGALVNLDGELVGINTAIYSPTGSYSGYSFAIPTSIVSKVVGDLKQYGTVQRAYLGVRIQDVTPELIKEMDIKGVVDGVYVASIEDQSAAMEAGLMVGDIIASVNGHATPNTANLQEAVAKCSPGDTIKIVFYRDGKKIEKSVTLRNGRGNTAITRVGDFTDLGCNFAPASRETLRSLNLSNGVEVKDLENGPAKAAGLREGMIVLAINQTPISKVEDVEKVYNAVTQDDKADKVLVVKAFDRTKQKVRFFTIELED